MGVRGAKKHLKRFAAPNHWMLDKIGGVFAPRPSPGPHRLRECLPLIILLRERLHYADNYVEVKKIVKQRLIKVDGKVRTHHCFPAGFMDVVSIDRTSEHFRLLYDVKGRFAVHRISPEESKYKLCKVKRVTVGSKGVPLLYTHDARTIRYPDPLVKTNDTILLDISSNKIRQFIKFEPGNLCMITGGMNLGRVGIVTHREKHPGAFDMIYVKDQLGHSFATRMNNVFIIGKGNKPWISLPKGRGVRLTISEERDKRLGTKAGSSTPVTKTSESEGKRERTSSSKEAPAPAAAPAPAPAPAHPAATADAKPGATEAKEKAAPAAKKAKAAPAAKAEKK